VPFGRAKKRFSQNFLVDPNIARQIVDLLEVETSDTIFEIGGGRGVLTGLIAETEAKLLCFEIDIDLADRLRSIYRNNDNVEIVNTDFLKVVPEFFHHGSFKLIGNIPYDITSPLIEWMVHYQPLIEKGVITMQREMAERIASGPGSKNWAPISIFTQCSFDLKIKMTIPPRAFSPRPKVQSSTVVFTPDIKYEIDNPELFESIVRASFKQRRKLLKNNLSKMNELSDEQVEHIMQASGIGPLIRAEQLSIEHFIRLTEEMSKIKT